MGSACIRKRNNPEANLPNMETSNTNNSDKMAFPKSNYDSFLTSEDYGGSAEKDKNKSNFSTF